MLFGLDIGYSGLGTRAIEDIPKEHTSVVSGVNGLMRTVGGSLSGAVTSLVLSTHLDHRTGQPTLTGYHTVFTVLGLVWVAAAALALSRTRTGRHGGNNHPDPLPNTGVTTPRTPLTNNAPSR